jgi:hypothetical protein
MKCKFWFREETLQREKEAIPNQSVFPAVLRWESYRIPVQKNSPSEGKFIGREVEKPIILNKRKRRPFPGQKQAPGPKQKHYFGTGGSHLNLQTASHANYSGLTGSHTPRPTPE